MSEKPDETTKTLYMLYKAWCRDNGLDPKEPENMKRFMDEELP